MRLEAQIIRTFPWRVLTSNSRFLTVASATGTITRVPMSFPVAGSTNCTRTFLPSSGILGISCCCLAFSDTAFFCLLLGGGSTVVILHMAEYVGNRMLSGFLVETCDYRCH